MKARNSDFQSMTGFSSKSLEWGNRKITCEIKSLNNRFLDFRFKMSSLFSPYEIEFRKKVEQFFLRGSFEINLYLKDIEHSDDTLEEKYDISKAIEYLRTLDAHLKSSQLNTPLNTNPEFFMKSDFERRIDPEDETFHENVLELFEAAMETLKKTRVDEGLEVRKVLNHYLEQLKEKHTQVLALLPKRENQRKEKIQKRLDEMLDGKLKAELDESRVHQELIFYLEKLDISEEIERFKIHLEQLSKIVNTDDAQDSVGKKIGFYLQELVRETNTMGSKSGDAELSQIVVEIKSFLEKMREQSLNIQ